MCPGRAVRRLRRIPPVRGGRSARGSELRLLAERECRAALGAAVAPRTFAHVVLSRERGMLTGTVAPCLLELDRFLALHSGILGTAFNGHSSDSQDRWCASGQRCHAPALAASPPPAGGAAAASRIADRPPPTSRRSC